MIVHEHLIFRPFPFVRSGKLEVLVKLHRLIFPDRFVAEIELLNLEVLVDRNVLVDVYVLGLVEARVIGWRNTAPLSGNWALQLVFLERIGISNRILLLEVSLVLVFLERIGISNRALLLEVLHVRIHAGPGGFELLAALRNIDLLRCIPAAALLFAWLRIVRIRRGCARERAQAQTDD